MEKTIKREHEHWKLGGILKQLLTECKTNESTRYAINGIHIEDGLFAATDGRRLVQIEQEHKIEPGNYFCTSDGYLLCFVDGKFPKYKEIIPSKGSLRKIVEVGGEGEYNVGLILGELCHAGCICKLSLYKRPAELLSKAICGKVKVFVNRKEPENHPFLIEAETSVGKMTYIQMPVNIKNEIKNTATA